MKRIIAVILLAVTVLTMAACQQVPKGTAWQHISKDGEAVGLTINFDDQTITASDEMVTFTAVGSDGTSLGVTTQEDKDVYHYTYDDGNITITYPNGATWWASSTAGGWSNDYDPERYIEGDILAQQLTQAYRSSGKNWDEVLLIGLICLVLIAVCSVDVLHPEIFFELRYRLWFRSVEPTEFALMMSRIAGIVGIVCAVILFLVAAFG